MAAGVNRPTIRQSFQRNPIVKSYLKIVLKAPLKPVILPKNHKLIVDAIAINDPPIRA